MTPATPPNTRQLTPRELDDAIAALAKEAIQGSLCWLQQKVRLLLVEQLALQANGLVSDHDCNSVETAIQFVSASMQQHALDTMQEAVIPSLDVQATLKEATMNAKYPVSAAAQGTDGIFSLYNLRAELTTEGGKIIGSGSAGSHQPGEYFDVIGENILPPPGQSISLYSLSSLLPILPSKQRPTNPHDWMTTDAVIAGPDPNCPSRFKITRNGHSVFLHNEVTAVPLEPIDRESGS